MTVVVFYRDFHPYLEKIPILTTMFRMGWFNHQPVLKMEDRPPLDVSGKSGDRMGFPLHL